MENLPLEELFQYREKEVYRPFPFQMKRKCWDVSGLSRNEKEAHGPRI